MKRVFLFAVVITFIALGAGCANQNETLFNSSNQSQGNTQVQLNSGSSLPSKMQSPTQIGTQ